MYSKFKTCFHSFCYLSCSNVQIHILIETCHSCTDTLVDVFLRRHHFHRSGLDAKLRAIQAVSVLLQGPSDVGNRTLEMSGMMDAVISLCASKDVTHQQVAVEALIHAAGKAKRASFITANGVALLKDLYKKSENDRIRVRALVVSAAAKQVYLFLDGLEQNI